MDLHHGLQLRVWSFEPLKDLIVIDESGVAENLSLNG